MEIVSLIENKDWDLLNDYLGDVDSDNIQYVIPYLSQLVAHKSWVIRVDAIELIEDFNLVNHVGIVKDLLQDRNKCVVSAALMCLYSLLGDKSEDIISCYIESKVVRIRLVAILLQYLIAPQKRLFEEMTRILTRKNCDYYNQYVVLHFFEDKRLILGKYPEFVDLLRMVKSCVSSKTGIFKDLSKFLSTQDR